MAILVTGASGFLGTALTRNLVDNGHEVVATYRDPSGLHRLGPKQSNVHTVPLDVTDARAVRALFGAHRFKVVYNVAAAGVRPEREGSPDVPATNILGPLHVARAAIASGVDRFVHVGSGFEYAPQGHPVAENAPVAPVNFYGATKAAASVLLDHLRRMEGLPLVIVRPFSVFGPGEHEGRLIPQVLSKALRGEEIMLTQGTQRRDYLHVSDVVEALRLAAEKPEAVGAAYNIGAGPEETFSVREVVTMAIQVAGGDPSLARFGAVRPARPEPASFVADPSRARRELGWQPRVGLRAGLESMKEAMLDA